MRKNIEKVLRAFTAGQVASGDTCSTDGKRVYSYRELIAIRCEDDSFAVVDEDTLNVRSRTTVSQVRACLVFLPSKTTKVVPRDELLKIFLEGDLSNVRV